MTSIKTQLPFEYYSIPICKPADLQYKPENLGKADFNGSFHIFLWFLDHFIVLNNIIIITNY